MGFLNSSKKVFGIVVTSLLLFAISCIFNPVAFAAISDCTFNSTNAQEFYKCGEDSVTEFTADLLVGGNVTFKQQSSNKCVWAYKGLGRQEHLTTVPTDSSQSGVHAVFDGHTYSQRCDLNTGKGVCTLIETKKCKTDNSYGFDAEVMCKAFLAAGKCTGHG